MNATTSQPSDAAAPAGAAQMSDGIYEMLRAAVNLTRDQQVRRLQTLRSRLQSLYPGRSDDIDAAIRYWAAYEQSKRY